MREFIPWSTPLLPAVAACMIAAEGGELGEWLIVVRGRAAGRRLLGLLAAEAQRTGCTLIPPRIITPGSLAEALFGAAASVAGELTQRLAWAAALERAPEELRARVWSAPAGHTRGASPRHLAPFLERTWRALNVAGVDFAEAFAILARLAPDSADLEQPRWLALQELLGAFREVLREWDLADPAAWRAGLLATGRRAPFRVALAGLVELSPVAVALLGLLENDPLIFIHAPEAEAAGFDAWGRLHPAHWAGRGCRFEHGEIHVVRGAGEQAARCAELIRAWKNDGLPASAITVAVPERAALSTLQQILADAGIAVRSAGGAPLARSSVLILLGQIADFLDRKSDQPPSYESAAALARHPDLRLAGNFLAKKFDAFFEDHLPAQIDLTLCENDAQRAPLAAALNALEDLATLRAESFAPDVTQLLLRVYEGRSLGAHEEGDRALLSALEAIRAALDEIESLPAAALAPFSPAELLRLVVEIAGGADAPEAEQPDAVELAGWLEAAADDAPALIVTSVFEGSLPAGAPTEPLLVDPLCEKLGLPCRASRLARDQFTLHSVWRSRRAQGRLALIAPRRTAEGTPARPSRLLLAAHADRELATRLLALLAETPGAAARPARSGGLQPPDLDVEKMRRFRAFRVTSFSTYLASPRLFYFQNICRLKVQDDTAEELGGGGFGSAIHTVLEAFGERHRGAAARLTAAEIERECTAELHDFMTRQYGRFALPPVLAQVPSLEERLRSFASKQAELFAEGWQIAYVERGGAVEVPFAVSGAPPDVSLRGRIDRVDFHPDGRVRVIDYKTSATAKQPTAAHYAPQLAVWRDLQLPLYLKLLPALALGENLPAPGEGLELVYFNLPPARAAAGISEPFDAALIPGAWERAAQIVAEVCSGEGCREIGDVPRNVAPVFGALCGVNGLPLGEGEED